MQFLIVTRNRGPMAPEMAMPMLQAMRAWVAEHRASGKIVDTWSFAGMAGGGGILEVESLEELDAVMGGFPYSQVSDVDVYGLANLDAMLDRNEAIITAMMQAMG